MRDTDRSTERERDLENLNLEGHLCLHSAPKRNLIVQELNCAWGLTRRGCGVEKANPQQIVLEMFLENSLITY